MQRCMPTVPLGDHMMQSEEMKGWVEEGKCTGKGWGYNVSGQVRYVGVECDAGS